MNKLVIDTNVIVAAMRSKQGASFKLISLLGRGYYELYLSVPLALEYEEVLERQRPDLGWTHDEVDGFLRILFAGSHKQDIHFLTRPTLPDPEDEKVLEVAANAGCDYIITYNKRDFVGAETYGVQVVDPKTFLEIIKVL